MQLGQAMAKHEGCGEDWAESRCGLAVGNNPHGMLVDLEGSMLDGVRRASTKPVPSRIAGAFTRVGIGSGRGPSELPAAP